MSLSLTASKREQSRKVELANSISPGLGLIAALVAAPFPIRHVIWHEDAA